MHLPFVTITAYNNDITIIKLFYEQFDYITHGTCSQLIHITLNDDNRIEEVTFLGGCNGNLKGIGALIRGQKPEDVIARLKGITCGAKQTSCPDQLAQALEQIIAND